MMMSRNEGEETDWGRGRGGEEPGSLPVYLSRWQACGETVRRGDTAQRSDRTSSLGACMLGHHTVPRAHPTFLCLFLSLSLALSLITPPPPLSLSLSLAPCLLSKRGRRCLERRRRSTEVRRGAEEAATVGATRLLPPTVPAAHGGHEGVHQ